MQQSSIDRFIPEGLPYVANMFIETDDPLLKVQCMSALELYFKLKEPIDLPHYVLPQILVHIQDCILGNIC